jgi:hypothetical protein
MDETLLLTVKSVAQAGHDLLILPSLSADEFSSSLGAIDRVKVVTPDYLVIEKDAEFAIYSFSCLLTPDTKYRKRRDPSWFSSLDQEVMRTIYSPSLNKCFAYSQGK